MLERQHSFCLCVPVIQDDPLGGSPELTSETRRAHASADAEITGLQKMFTFILPPPSDTARHDAMFLNVAASVARGFPH
jgi:hypothetical protein